jgi:hypothetical protein
MVGMNADIEAAVISQQKNMRVLHVVSILGREKPRITYGNRIL